MTRRNVGHMVSCHVDYNYEKVWDAITSIASIGHYVDDKVWSYACLNVRLQMDGARQPVDNALR